MNNLIASQILTSQFPISPISQALKLDHASQLPAALVMSGPMGPILGRIIFAVVVGGPILAIPCAAITYGWKARRVQTSGSEWRRMIASVGIFAVLCQTVLLLFALLAIAVYNTRYRSFLSQSVIAEFVLLLLAAPCTFAWKQRPKWWLLFSSFFLPIVSFFLVLAVLAY